MIVGIDVDGVIRDFVSSVERVYDKYHPNNNRTEVNEYDFSHSFPNTNIWDFIYRDHPGEIFFDALPYSGSKQFMGWLRRYCQIKIITAQPNTETEDITVLWLLKHNIYYDEIIFTNDKHEQNFHLIVDDSPKNIIDISNAGKDVVCMKRPWNKGVWGVVDTVSNFSELKQVVMNRHGSLS